MKITYGKATLFVVTLLISLYDFYFISKYGNPLTKSTPISFLEVFVVLTYVILLLGGVAGIIAFIVIYWDKPIIK